MSTTKLPRRRTFWSNLPLRGKGFIVVAIPFLALVVSSLFSYMVDREQDKANAWVEHTLLVRSEIANLREAVLKAETGLRGYLLTGRDEFLDPYRAAPQGVTTLISRLFDSVNDNPGQTAELRRVQSAAAEKVAWMAQVVEKGAGTTLPPADREALQLEGKRRMDALNREISILDAEEERLHGERAERVRRLESWGFVVEIGGLVIGLLGGWLAVELFSNGIVRRMLRLRESAKRLAAGLPLDAAPAGGDEISALARDLEKAGSLLLERGRAVEEGVLHVHQSESRYRALAANFPNGSVFLFDQDLRFLVADGQGLAETGPSREALEGRTVSEAFPPETAAVLEPLYRLALAGERQVREVPFADRLYLVHSLPIREDDGQIYAGMVVTQDITERKRVERALDAARQEADRANLAKSEFLSRMSHELRTPLNAILGFGQLLELSNLGTLETESTQQILKAGRHLLDLINEVLAISRIEAGHISLSLEPVALAAAIEEALGLVAPQAKQRQILCRNSTTCSNEDGLHVLADRQRLRQVILNLLSNAIKYNREGGRVELACRELPAAGGEARRVRMEVADTGPGLMPEEISRLFTPFERLSAERGTVEGTGLGLALSRGLVEAMGGRIGAESVPGEGSTFWLELTAADDPITHAAGTAGPVSDSPSEEFAGTVLYIEDNLSNLRLIEMILEKQPGIELLSAQQGTLGLELARARHPDLILLDLHLADVPGWEVLKRLQADARTRGIPTAIISADATSGQIARLLEGGACEYLTKPIDVGKFLETLRKHVRPRNAQLVAVN